MYSLCYVLTYNLQQFTLFAINQLFAKQYTVSVRYQNEIDISKPSSNWILFLFLVAAPNKYLLPSSLGKTVEGTMKQSPMFTQRGRSNVGGFHEDLQKVIFAFPLLVKGEFFCQLFIDRTVFCAGEITLWITLIRCCSFT